MNVEKSYNRALDYLYSFVDYSLKHSSELAKADFNLDRMRALMAELGNPQDKYPIIHVAGTKGKGSVCALCASALVARGSRTGLYTSPHLLDYTERIQIDGKPISHIELVQLVEQIRPAVALIPKLTTFEITTAIGLLCFAQQNVDAAVIEVGLGGRLDATNVVLPKVSVITSLSYDHTAVLGDTLDKIACEKAGIIKSEVPVVSAPQKDEALEVLRCVARDRNAPLTLVGRDIMFNPIKHSLDGQSFKLLNQRGQPSEVELSLPLLGLHQVENATTAYAALLQSDLCNSAEEIREGFTKVRWPARFEIARREPPVIFDSAHNEDSFARLRQALDDYFPNKRVYLVFGSSEDKNISGMLAEIKTKVKVMFVTKAIHPRASDPERIQASARQVAIPHEVVGSVEAAFNLALEMSEEDGGIVLSAGSMFVTAEVMAAWKKRPKTDQGRDVSDEFVGAQASPIIEAVMEER